MRTTDQKAPKEARNRLIRSIAGLVVVVAGAGFAFWSPEEAPLGFIVALLGAGVIDPSQVLNFFVKK